MVFAEVRVSSFGIALAVGSESEADAGIRREDW